MIYSLLIDQSKIFTVYLDFTKNYFKIFIKKLYPELKRAFSTFIQYCTQLKKKSIKLCLDKSKIFIIRKY